MCVVVSTPIRGDHEKNKATPPRYETGFFCFKYRFPKIRDSIRLWRASVLLVGIDVFHFHGSISLQTKKDKKKEKIRFFAFACFETEIRSVLLRLMCRPRVRLPYKVTLDPKQSRGCRAFIRGNLRREPSEQCLFGLLANCFLTTFLITLLLFFAFSSCIYALIKK